MDSAARVPRELTLGCSPSPFRLCRLAQIQGGGHGKNYSDLLSQPWNSGPWFLSQRKVCVCVCSLAQGLTLPYAPYLKSLFRLLWDWLLVVLAVPRSQMMKGSHYPLFAWVSVFNCRNLITTNSPWLRLLMPAAFSFPLVPSSSTL